MAKDEEDPKERLNRKLMELLNEVRVALPGVQVLFAFLLILPFSQGFETVSDLQKGVYALAFGCAAMASLLLIGPSAYHRHRWRQLDKETMQEKEEMLVAQSRFVIGGLMLIALAVTGARPLSSALLPEQLDRTAGPARGRVPPDLASA